MCISLLSSSSSVDSTEKQQQKTATAVAIRYFVEGLVIYFIFVESIQAELEGTNKNQAAFETIARQMGVRAGSLREQTVSH